MGSGLSQEADTQQTHAIHQNSKNTKTKNLPHDCDAILKDADNLVDKPSIHKLYDGVYLNKKKQKYWVDKASHANCFLVFARDLSVTWSENNLYWQWSCVQETSEESVDVAELLNVCWLEVHGKFNVAKLTPGMKYEVVFIVMLKDDPVHGWHVPINVRLILPDGNKQHQKENLMEKPRSKWFEIKVGEFMVEPNKKGYVEFSLYEYEGGAWKTGLVVKGAAITPKK